MKRIPFISLALITSVLVLTPPRLAPAADASGARKFEFAIIKWDGPDRIQYILPDRFEAVRLGDSGVKIPKGAQEEEFCLNYAANQLAKEGWEAVNLNSRRILMRRAANR